MPVETSTYRDHGTSPPGATVCLPDNVESALRHPPRRATTVLGLLAVLLAVQIVPWWTPTTDGAAYLSIARSIARGGSPRCFGSPMLFYPPGYPLLISPAFLLANRPFLPLALLQWLQTVAFMLGVYVWARRWFPRGCLWIVALVMVNTSLWMHARATLSELAFMALLVWSANVMDYLLRLRASVWRVAAWSALLAAMVAALSMVRPVGVLLAAGYGLVALAMAWKGQVSWRRAIATVLAAGVPASAAILGLMSYESRMAATVGKDNRYVREFTIGNSYAAQVLEGVRLRVMEIGRLSLPGMQKCYAGRGIWWDVNLAVYTPLCVGMAWAWWRLAREAPSAMVWTFPLYAGLYCVYAWDQGTRYMLPTLPILAACGWCLVSQLPRFRTVAMTFLVVAHLAVAVGNCVRTTRDAYQADAQWPAFDAFAQRIDGERRTVAMQAPSPLIDMLMVAADRKVVDARQASGQAKAVSAGWLVAPNDGALPAGFIVRSEHGDFALLEQVEIAATPKHGASGQAR